MKSERHRQVASIAALLLAGAATIATSPGPGPSVSDESAFDMSLTDDHPYEVRQLDVAFDNGRLDAGGVSLSAGSISVDPNQYWVALLPFSDDEPVRNWTQSMSYRDGEDPFNLDESCLKGCAKSYLLVVGRQDGVAEVDGDMQVTMSAYFDRELATPVAGASVDLTLSEDRSGEFGVAEIRVEPTAGRLVIEAANEPRWTGTLHVTGAPPFKEGVGLLEFQFNATLGDANATAQVAINVDGAYILVESIYSERVTDLVTVEWLEVCRGKAECDVPIELETDWDPFPESTDSARRPGTVTVDFTINARLIFIGMDKPPAGATLELVPR
jgi:hypothetical protein